MREPWLVSEELWELLEPLEPLIRRGKVAFAIQAGIGSMTAAT